MTADTTPSLVERLSDPLSLPGETTVQMITRWRAERREAANRIEALEASTDLAYAAHLLARAEAAEANARRLEEALRPFVAEAARIHAVESVSTIGDNVEVWQSGSGDLTRTRITYGDLRKAVAALSTTKEADRGPE